MSDTIRIDDEFDTTKFNRMVSSHQALIDALELAMSTLAGCAPVSIPEADRASAIKQTGAALKLAKGEA